MAAEPEPSALNVPVAWVELQPELPEFGGLSGLEVEGPDHLVAASDRGWIMRIAKRAPHRVTGFQALGGLPRQYHLRDVESLRRAPDGGWWVAFEGANRIAWHRPGWAGLLQPPKRVLLRTAFPGVSGNRGLESVAALPDGRGLAILEQTGNAPALLFDADGRVLRRLAYRTAIPPVDALALPDGGLLILTRRLAWPLPLTFVTRLEYAAPGWDEGEGFESRPLFRLNTVLPAENYEGLAAEPLASGGWRIWLVSDDNQLFLQSTILAWLDLPTECFAATATCRLQAAATERPPPAPMPRSRPNPSPQ